MSANGLDIYDVPPPVHSEIDYSKQCTVKVYTITQSSTVLEMVDKQQHFETRQYLVNVKKIVLILIVNFFLVALVFTTLFLVVFDDGNSKNPTHNFKRNENSTHPDFTTEI